MKSFQRKRGLRNILQSKPVLFFLGLLLLIFVWGVFRFMVKMQITIENRKIVENKLAELEKNKEKLSFDIAKLQTKGGVEESIRNKFGLVKDGEGEIIIVEDKNLTEVKEKESGGFFSFFWNWFK